MTLAFNKKLTGFSKRWIEYCNEKGIKYKLVDLYDSNVINELKDCDALMWHTHHLFKKDYQASKRIINALTQVNFPCFPSFFELWHYDDKVGQKYLLESINAPLIPSYVFYDKEKAIAWAKNTNWPKVFKLTGGAGSSNVKLIHSEKQARKLIHRAFGKGFKIMDQKKYYFEELISKYKKNKSIFKFIKGLYHLTKPTNKNWVDHIEKDYVYFQEFLPNNDFDLRLVVVNQERIFGLKRYNRKKDFRASGSGNQEYLKENDVDKAILKLALETSKNLKMNSVAYDIVFDQSNNPFIIEISYAYSTRAYEKCPGYWNENLDWVNGEIGNYSGWMVEKIIEEIQLMKNI